LETGTKFVMKIFAN